MSPNRLKILMAETVSAPAQEAADALASAGHEVRTCHDRCEVGFACAALLGRPCPLEDGDVDTVVLVRPSTRREATPLEHGALCGARRHVPLVVAGSVKKDPYGRWAAAEQDGTDVVEVVEAVARAPLPQHSQVATAALVESLRRHGGGFESCSARVLRRRGTLHVELKVDPEPDADLRQAASTRVHQRLRALDPWTPRIEISFPGR